MSENNNVQKENIQNVEFIKDQKNNSSNNGSKNDTKSKIEESLKKYNFNIDPDKLPKVAPKNNNSMILAILVHLSMILTLSPIIPLIVFLVKKDDQFAIENAKEDINLYLTFFLINFILWIIIFFGRIYFLFGILTFTFCVAVIYACFQNYKGGVARIPYIFRIIS